MPLMEIEPRQSRVMEENLVHETALISVRAKVGKNNTFGPNVFIGPGVTVGDDNDFSAGFCSVGTTAEHRDYFDKPGKVVIGNHNVIREFTTINASTYGATSMGNFCIMLRGSHLSHDSILEDMVNVSCNVLIGGESHIMEGANLGLGAILHQRSVIGSYCMIGMGAVVTKRCDVVPGTTWAGNPAKFLKHNEVGLTRARIDNATLMQEIARYQQIKNLRSRRGHA